MRHAAHMPPDSEALRSKVSLHCFPPGRLIEPRGKQCKLRKRTPQADFFDTLKQGLKGPCFLLFQTFYVKNEQ